MMRSRTLPSIWLKSKNECINVTESFTLQRKLHTGNICTCCMYLSWTWYLLLLPTRHWMKHPINDPNQKPTTSDFFVHDIYLHHHQHIMSFINRQHSFFISFERRKKTQFQNWFMIYDTITWMGFDIAIDLNRSFILFSKRSAIDSMKLRKIRNE